MPLDKSFLYKFIKVTEKAAVGAYNFLGKDNKIAADKAAVDPMRFELNRIEELKERPVINILDVGEVATEESKPLRILIVLSSTLIAFILSGFFMYCYDGVRKNLE